MHEHDEICLKYMVRCHMGPTKSSTNKMGLPNQQNWKFLQEIKFSQPNTKITPTLGFMKLKTKSKE